MGAFETRTLRRIVLKGEIMKRKQKTSEATFRIIVFTVLAVFSIIFVIMLGWTVLNSLKTKEDFNFYPMEFPKQLRFDNYSKVFGVLYIDVLKVGVGMIRYNFSSMFINSLIYAVGCTFFTIFPKAICGYVFAHYNFRMKKFLFNLAMVVMILPVIGALASELSIMKFLGIYDNVLALMVMKAGFGGMDFLIFYTVYKGVSWEYAEAALVDGAGPFKIMMSIMLPMGKATIAIFSLTSFITFWNDWSVNVVYLPSWPVAAYSLYYFQNSTNNVIAEGGVPFILTSSIIFCMPIFVLFIVFKKQMFENLNFGGLKG